MTTLARHEPKRDRDRARVPFTGHTGACRTTRVAAAISFQGPPKKRDEGAQDQQSAGIDPHGGRYRSAVALEVQPCPDAIS